MKQAGRPSAMSVVRVTAMDRPRPPKGMTKAQRDLWNSITATKPADWFTDDTLPLLAAYCDAWHVHQLVSKVLRRRTEAHLVDPDERREFAKLEGVQRGAASSLASLASKMRLSQSARYGHRAANTKHERTLQGSKKPWQGYGD